MVECLVCNLFILIILTFPETPSASSDIPVGEIVNVINEDGYNLVEIVLFHFSINRCNCVVEKRNDPVV